MDKASLNKAMQILLENVHSVLKCTILLLEQDSINEAEKKKLVETMHTLCNNLDIVKDSIDKIEASMQRKIIKEGNIKFGNN